MNTVPGSKPAPLPTIDISRKLLLLASPLDVTRSHFVACFSGDSLAQELVTEQIRGACLRNGFFQIINHGVPVEIQKAVFEQSKTLFDLADEEKTKFSKGSFSLRRHCDV